MACVKWYQLQNDGYKTALIGKYHLGEPTSCAQGFDHWVTLEDGHVRSFYRNKIFDNGEVYDQPGHSVDFFTNKAKEYMAEQASSDQMRTGTPNAMPTAR